MIIKFYRICFVGKIKRKIIWENNNMEKLINSKINKFRWIENIYNVNILILCFFFFIKL